VKNGPIIETKIKRGAFCHLRSGSFTGTMGVAFSGIVLRRR
jgi:hypothetical protein